METHANITPSRTNSVIQCLRRQWSKAKA